MKLILQWGGKNKKIKKKKINHSPSRTVVPGKDFGCPDFAVALWFPPHLKIHCRFIYFLMCLTCYSFFFELHLNFWKLLLLYQSLSYGKHSIILAGSFGRETFASFLNTSVQLWCYNSRYGKETTWVCEEILLRSVLIFLARTHWQQVMSAYVSH